VILLVAIIHSNEDVASSV